MIYKNKIVNLSGIFLGQIWDLISAPCQFKNKQKFPKMFYMYIIPNFLGLDFGYPNKSTKVVDA